MIFPKSQPRCTTCLTWRREPVHDDGVCTSCRPAEYVWPGTVPLTDLIPFERSKEVYSWLEGISALDPDQIRVWMALSHGSARESDREAFVASRDWSVPELSGSWFGVPGVRYRGVILFTEQEVSLGLGDYGLRFLFKMQAACPDSGELCDLKWWTGESAWVTVGADELADLTVKSHDTYQGKRETVVNRVTNPLKPKKPRVKKTP